MTFADKIIKLRKERGWSQSDLARKIGVHMGHISRIEHNKANPSIEVLRKITKAFEINADYLLNEDADSPTPVEIKDKSLAEKVKLIEQLDEADKTTIINVIESILTKKKMLDLLTKQTSSIAL